MVWNIILIALGAYLLINILLYALQERFLFHPEKLSEDFKFEYDRPFEEITFKLDDGVRIHGLKFNHPNPVGLVFYLHGNTRSVKGWARYAVDFLKHGYEVILVDYRGFGKSTGKRSERHIKNDLQTIYSRLADRYGEDHLIVYGRSMGSGFATKVASQNSPQMLILNAPYYSLMDTVKRYLFFIPLAVILRYKIKTYQWIRYVDCPIYIIHGTRDSLIPMGSSVRLSKIKPRQTTLFPIQGANHHNLTEFPEYHRVIYGILEK